MPWTNLCTGTRGKPRDQHRYDTGINFAYLFLTNPFLSDLHLTILVTLEQATTVQAILYNRSEEEDLTGPFASSPAVYNKVVDTVRNNNIFYRKLHAVYITIDGCHYVWQKAQTAILHYTREPAD